MIDTDKYGEQDWLVRWFDSSITCGDAMDYDNFEEAFEAFKISVDEQPDLEWTLTHFYDYTYDDEGGWYEPLADTLLYWEGEDDPQNPLAEQIKNMLSMRVVIE